MPAGEAEMFLARPAHLLENVLRDAPRQIAVGSLRASFCLRFISFPEEHRQCFLASLQQRDDVQGTSIPKQRSQQKQVGTQGRGHADWTSCGGTG